MLNYQRVTAKLKPILLKTLGFEGVRRTFEDLPKTNLAIMVYPFTPGFNTSSTP